MEGAPDKGAAWPHLRHQEHREGSGRSQILLGPKARRGVSGPRNYREGHFLSSGWVLGGAGVDQCLVVGEPRCSVGVVETSAGSCSITTWRPGVFGQGWDRLQLPAQGQLCLPCTASGSVASEPLFASPVQCGPALAMGEVNQLLWNAERHLEGPMGLCVLAAPTSSPDDTALPVLCRVLSRSLGKGRHSLW